MQGSVEPQARKLADALVIRIENSNLWDELGDALYHRDVRSLEK